MLRLCSTSFISQPRYLIQTIPIYEPCCFVETLEFHLYTFPCTILILFTYKTLLEISSGYIATRVLNRLGSLLLERLDRSIDVTLRRMFGAYHEPNTGHPVQARACQIEVFPLHQSLVESLIKLVVRL